MLKRVLAFFVVLEIASGLLRAEETAFIRVNQVGYLPRGAKLAIALGRARLPSRFQLINASTQAVVFEGRAKPIADAWEQFSHHAELDFSGFDGGGEFKIRLGAAESTAFRIHSKVY